MAKTPRRRERRDAKASSVVGSRLKMFRPVSWSEHSSAHYYTSHLIMELGRLGMKIEDIENYSRAPSTKSVLSDLLEWFESYPNAAYARLVDWNSLNLGVLRTRSESDRRGKPRIEVSAELSKMHNLSVRWHPWGWHESEFDWDRPERHPINLITHRKWQEPPDFYWFQGDEDPYFDSRPSNELMFVHGVGNLRTEPREEYGPFSKFNTDIVDSILICAVRAAYAGLIRQLKLSFEVAVMTDFEFTTRAEANESDPIERRFPTHRVVVWTIDSTSAISARQERAREEQERAELANLSQKVGFSVATLIDALSKAALKKRTGPTPSGEHINTSAAKFLREVGHKIDAGQVRRLRKLLERHSPEQLPEALKPAPLTTSASNVVPFRNEES